MYEYNIQEALMSQRAGTFPEGISTSPGNPFAGTHPPGGPAPMHPSLPSALRAQVPAGYEAAASANSVGQPPSSGGGAVYSSSLILAGQDCNDGASTVAIDNKIEQAMDLVKSHLMFAVREEVEVLKEQIKELLEKNSQLEYENSILRSSASPETLSQLSTAAPAVVPSSQGPTKASQPPPPTTS